MRKRKHIEELDNHERWLVSYADFITLLFAFFVVMYSLSSINDGKYRSMSNSVLMAFGKSTQSSQAPNSPILKENPNHPSSKIKKVEEPLRQERAKMTGLAQGILSVLAPLIREGKVRVTQTSRGISIDINASVLFASAEANLNPKSSQVLAAIATVLANDNHDIQIEGFTDNQPIKNSQFPSNWELSAVRASSVARLFMDNGIAENRLTAIGQGPKSPVDSNENSEGRSKNRRVNITILALLPESKTEVPLPSSR